ncbi:MAG: hypothetical protein WA139_04865 [Candidatus Aenigmatarchaeota archaeon]
MNKSYFSILAVAFVLSTMMFSSFAGAAYGSVGMSYTLLDGKLKPGQSSAVTLTFSNTATGTAYNIKVYVTAGSSIKPEKTYFELGSLGASASQTTTLNFDVDSSAVSGTSFITLTAKYNQEGASSEQESAVTIPVTIYREPILQLSNVKFNASRVKPDDVIQMSFNVANVGVGGAKDVRISLQNSSAYTYIGNNEQYASSIPSSGSQPFSFLLQIGSNTKAGIYSVPLQLSYYYEDGKQNKTEAKNANMEIFGKAKLGISNIKTDPSPVKEGGFTSLIVKVENTGTGDAKSVRVSIDSPFASGRVSLGKIAADEDASAVFSFNANQAGDIPYALAVEYEDDFGKSGVNDTEKLTVYKKDADMTIYIIALAAAAAAGFLLYRRGKKK